MWSTYYQGLRWFIWSSWIVRQIGGQDLYFCESQNPDPCAVANEKPPFEPEARFESCPDTNNGLCDRYITPGWYRYNDRMLDRCPLPTSCGTLYPSWLNGSHPTVVNTEVVRTVCKVGFSSCCERQMLIKIRNCGHFMAYCLPALETCPERFCFGESGTCFPTITRRTTDAVTENTSPAVTSESTLITTEGTTNLASKLTTITTPKTTTVHTPSTLTTSKGTTSLATTTAIFKPSFSQLVSTSTASTTSVEITVTSPLTTSTISNANLTTEKTTIQKETSSTEMTTSTTDVERSTNVTTSTTDMAISSTQMPPIETVEEVSSTTSFPTSASTLAISKTSIASTTITATTPITETSAATRTSKTTATNIAVSSSAGNTNFTTTPGTSAINNTTSSATTKDSQSVPVIIIAAGACIILMSVTSAVICKRRHRKKHVSENAYEGPASPLEENEYDELKNVSTTFHENNFRSRTSIQTEDGYMLPAESAVINAENVYESEIVDRNGLPTCTPNENNGVDHPTTTESVYDEMHLNVYS